MKAALMTAANHGVYLLEVKESCEMKKISTFLQMHFSQIPGNSYPKDLHRLICTCGSNFQMTGKKRVRSDSVGRVNGTSRVLVADSGLGKGSARGLVLYF